QLDSVRMGFDLLGLGRKLGSRSRVRRLTAIRIDVVNRNVRIGNRRLFEVLIDAAAPAHEAALQLDRHASAASKFMMTMAVMLRNRIVRYPFNAVIDDVLVPFFARGNVLAIASTVYGLRQVA